MYIFSHFINLKIFQGKSENISIYDQIETNNLKTRLLQYSRYYCLRNMFIVFEFMSAKS